ncbi:hypothetical protein AAFO92_05380 [Roseovarius sp. CAU 1744]|uniref:hypothetical protein n=1 Tax=Roseovarius sp. CAU 1744 TaxID=3140368 RepID=UPI00325B9727
MVTADGSVFLGQAAARSGARQRSNPPDHPDGFTVWMFLVCSNVMPVSFPPVRPHPGKPFHRLKDAARLCQVMTVRCNLCHRKTNFLASDLIKVVDPDLPAHQPPFPCSRCKTTEYINVRLRVPDATEIGKLPIRRPDRIIQKWRTVMLGDP